MSVQSVGQVVQSVKLFAGNGVGSSKDLIFIDFVGLCSWKKSKKACSSSSLRISVNGSNVQRSFLGSRKNWASFIKSVLDLERANSASQQSSDLKPKAANLEDVLSERGACGVGFIANLDKKASHEIVNDALTAFGCMEHRGGVGTDNDSGDDSGLMTSIPWELFDNWANEPL